MALGLVGAILAGACSSSGSDGGRTAGGASGGDRLVERLTVALPRDAGPITPFSDAAEPGIIELVYDKLLSPSPYVDAPQPWLADQVRAVDPSTWEVTVRQGVTWQDGVPFTSADVAFTFEYFRKTPGGRYTHHVSDVPNIERIEEVDAATLRFRCAYPCPDLGPVTLADLPIIPRHLWQDVTQPATFTGLPIGTGPYRLVDYDRARGYRFEANPTYFAGAPLVRELVMPIIEDASATFTALQTGEIDVATRSVPPELIEQYKNDRDIHLATVKPLEWVELRLNFRRSPFDVPEVRRALSRAVDRRDLLATVQLDHGRQATRGYPHPNSPWTDPSLSTPTDPAEARRLLDGAGLTDRDGDGVRQRADGSALTFTIKTTGSEPTHVRAAGLVADHLAAVGIRATVQTLDAGGFNALFRTYDFDMAVGQIGAHGVADPTQFIMSHRAGYLWQSPSLAYPEWDALFERWKAASTLPDRKALLFQMEQLFNRQPTAIPLFYPDGQRAFRAGSYGRWVESPGFAIVHKWSFLPIDVGRRANAISQEFR